MMVLASAAFFACASPLSFLWFFVWRVAAGLAGGMLMALAAPSVLPRVPAARRGLAGGIIFTGVGLGIAASGTLVPLLLRAGLAATWCGLGGLAPVADPTYLDRLATGRTGRTRGRTSGASSCLGAMRR